MKVLVNRIKRICDISFEAHHHLPSSVLLQFGRSVVVVVAAYWTASRNETIVLYLRFCFNVQLIIGLGKKNDLPPFSIIIRSYHGGQSSLSAFLCLQHRRLHPASHCMNSSSQGSDMTSKPNEPNYTQSLESINALRVDRTRCKTVTQHVLLLVPNSQMYPLVC